MSDGKFNSNQKPYANETVRLLFERSSCRSFLDKTIPQEVLNAVLEAGTHSASAGNLQPYSIIKIENLENRLKLGRDVWAEFHRESSSASAVLPRSSPQRTMGEA